MKRPQTSLLSIAIFVLAGCAAVTSTRLNKQHGAPDAAARSRIARETKGIDFLTEVKPILDRRCVMCHSCYDSPCQLNLTSYSGLERGGTKENVYDTGRLTEASPTRLNIDAKTAEEWRRKDFHPVLNERNQTPEANQAVSVLARMLHLKKDHPLPQTPVLPDSFDFSLDRKAQCPAIEKFDSFSKKHPLWGMPYGLPGISDGQMELLMQWIAQGAPYSAPAPLSSQHLDRIARWETFLNGESNKEQLMSRYLYEHLFLAHFYFDDLPPGEFFTMVRSKTPPGEPIDLVTTRRVYDDPDVKRVFYRFMRVENTIVAKRHLPYVLNAKRMARWKELFLTPNYPVDRLPSYKEEVASNPFATFKDIPVKSRYQMMLDEAQFTIMGFIKGPVCRGQVALNVIQDHFWIFFVNPDVLYGDDKAAAFLAENSDYLALPAQSGSQTLVLTTWKHYASLQEKYLEKKAGFVTANLSDPSKLTMNTIWDGDGVNPNAALTVFRHFDSATVVKGFVGEPPKTALVAGYALVERIHYLLVAGYDVYGNVGHQVSTRLYMDFLRMEGESHFLALLPKDTRVKERDLWYRDAKKSVKEYVYGIRSGFDVPTGIVYATDNPKQELYDHLKRHLAKVSDRRYEWAGKVKDPLVAQQLERLASLKGTALGLLPEVTIVHIRGTGYVTLLRNSAHAHITSLLDQKKQRLPAEDTLTVVYGFLGDYPEVFMDIDPARLTLFVDALAGLKKEAEYAALLDTYGIRRTDIRFWDFSDQTQEANLKWGGSEAGLFDYNRYENR